MAVARKHHQIPERSTTPAPRPRPRRVNDAETLPTAANPVAEHLIRLEDAFSAAGQEEIRRYPRKVRLAILIGAPTLLWVLIAGAIVGVRALF